MSRTVKKDNRVKYCCGYSSQVVNSRDSGIASANTRGVYRRRFCRECGESWTTAEVSIDTLLASNAQAPQGAAQAVRNFLELLKDPAFANKLLSTIEVMS